MADQAPAPSAERLRAIAEWAEERSSRARLQSTKKYEADVAAACRVAIAIHALLSAPPVSIIGGDGAIIGKDHGISRDKLRAILAGERA